jgi:hypothetical protein
MKAGYMAAIFNLRTNVMRVLDNEGRPYKPVEKAGWATAVVL